MNEENRRGARAQAPERRGARAQAPGAAHDAAENAVSLPPPACREGRRPRLVEQERRRRRRARNPTTAGHHAPPATPARCAQPGHRGSPQGAGGHHTSPCGTTTERDEHPVRRPLSAGVAARRARQAIGTWEAGRAQRPGRDGGVGGQHLNHARRDHCSICLAHSSSPPPPPPSWWGGTTAPPIASAPVLAPPPPPCGGRRAVASAYAPRAGIVRTSPPTVTRPPRRVRQVRGPNHQNAIAARRVRRRGVGGRQRWTSWGVSRGGCRGPSPEVDVGGGRQGRTSWAVARGGRRGGEGGGGGGADEGARRSRRVPRSRARTVERRDGTAGAHFSTLFL